jgi:hypothetical protein
MELLVPLTASGMVTLIAWARLVDHVTHEAGVVTATELHPSPMAGRLS